jgi:hypothetical protein
MRLSDAALHCRRPELIYLNHRLPPWLTEAATRDRSKLIAKLQAANKTRECAISLILRQ